MPPVRYNARVVYYTTEAEKEKLDAEAARRNLKFSEFMRGRVETPKPATKKRSAIKGTSAKSPAIKGSARS
jgi:hypothetical protein